MLSTSSQCSRITDYKYAALLSLVGGNYPRRMACLLGTSCPSWRFFRSAISRPFSASSKSLLGAPVITEYNLTMQYMTLQRVPGNEWKDRAGVSAPLMRACFPSAAIEGADHWEDLINLDRTFVFDRAMIISRETAHRQCVCHFLFPINAKCSCQPLR